MPKKILFIEDEEFLADMYKMKFEKEGYKVMVARDGTAGIELARRESPDLIMLDLVMPGLDGFQVLNELKNDEKTKAIKVFILSNLGQTEEIDRGLKNGADGYLIKANLTPSQLTGKVKKILKELEIKAAVKTGQQIKSNQESEIKSKDISAVKAKVLLIEDNEAILNMYKFAFLRAGFEVDIAQNGAWGLKLALENSYQAIILDMVMPAMNGYETINRLKESEKSKNIPIIIISNSAQDREMKKAKNCGAARCLLKSRITPAKLIKEVKKIIKN